MTTTLNAALRLQATEVDADAVSPKEAGKLLQYLTSHIGKYTSKKQVQSADDPSQDVRWTFPDKSSIRVFNKTERPLLGLSIDKGGRGADFYGKTAGQIIKKLENVFIDGGSHFQISHTLEGTDAYKKLLSGLASK